MNTAVPDHTVPGAMYVKALYDYHADDHTSLSFRQGEIIQVITQLESGWWDGVIRGTRGWFPSNYCAVVPPTGATTSSINGHMDSEESEGESVEQGMVNSRLNRHNTTATRSQVDAGEAPAEEAAFWIPQATPDGRLFYFNTLTGVSTMELPLETPSANETGPRDRTNVYVPDTTRPPPELVNSGHERHESADEEGVSDAEGTFGSKSSSVRIFVESLCSLPFFADPECRTTGDHIYQKGFQVPPQWIRSSTRPLLNHGMPQMQQI